eukprot:790430-Rhodomonas_salina.7
MAQGTVTERHPLPARHPLPCSPAPVRRGQSHSKHLGAEGSTRHIQAGPGPAGVIPRGAWLWGSERFRRGGRTSCSVSRNSGGLARRPGGEGPPSLYNCTQYSAFSY